MLLITKFSERGHLIDWFIHNDTPIYPLTACPQSGSARKCSQLPLLLLWCHGILVLEK